MASPIPDPWQATSMGYPEVNEANVYLCTGDPLPVDIHAIVKSLLNDSYSDAFACEGFRLAPCEALAYVWLATCLPVRLSAVYALQMVMPYLAFVCVPRLLHLVLCFVPVAFVPGFLSLCCAVVRSTCVEKGYALTDVLTQVSKYGRRLGLPDKASCQLLAALSDVE